jgi:succinate dehydrogenase / fumarate reductase flavoprotein subunit
VFLDIASRRDAEYIQRRLPSMYHQFKQLADVDITKESMEIGPTAHYVMGGVRVDAETTASTVPGLFAAGEVAGGMHGSNRLGGNSLSDLLVFGRRAGIGAAEYAHSLSSMPGADTAQIEEAAAEALAPFESEGNENPYTIHHELQDMMQSLVGIIRNQGELEEAQSRLGEFKERAKHARVEGNRQYNPGWHLALDLRSMLTVAELITQGAIQRKESRGGHTREDYPNPDAHFGTVNIAQRLQEGELTWREEPLPKMPDDLMRLFEED